LMELAIIRLLIRRLSGHAAPQAGEYPSSD
jgi:hypothetical protein